MPVPKEQPPRKLSGSGTDVFDDTLERGACARRRDNDLRRKDRGGITRMGFHASKWCRMI